MPIQICCPDPGILLPVRLFQRLANEIDPLNRKYYTAAAISLYKHRVRTATDPAHDDLTVRQDKVGGIGPRNVRRLRLKWSGEQDRPMAGR